MMNKGFVAVDFGTNDALALYGPDGPMDRPKLPRVAGGASTRDKFIRTLPILLEDYDVVVESATVGSSGVEVNDVVQIVADAPNHLYTVSGRAVKNYRSDAERGYLGSPREWRKGARYAKGRIAERIKIEPQEDVHVEDAEIIWLIATGYSHRLRRWLPNDGFQRQYTSVRPHDKRNYRGNIPDHFMRRFPPFEQLPPQLQELLGIGDGENRSYSRAKAMPFAMALDEPSTETRTGYEKVIGLYEHGYPSFYRRATVTLMQGVAKRQAGVTRFSEVSPAVRKQAWRDTRRAIRQLYHLLQR
jgi:hypothetical protein